MEPFRPRSTPPALVGSLRPPWNPFVARGTAHIKESIPGVLICPWNPSNKLINYQPPRLSNQVPVEPLRPHGTHQSPVEPLRLPWNHSVAPWTLAGGVLRGPEAFRIPLDPVDPK